MVDTCLVDIVYYDVSANVRVQATMPCSKTSSNQIAGRTGREGPGMVARFVNQGGWDLMSLDGRKRAFLKKDTRVSKRAFYKR